MAVLTVNQLSRAGLDLDALAVAAASGGDKIPNSGRAFLYVKNASAGSVTVTLDIKQKVDGQDPADRTVAVAAGKAFLIGPFPTSIYNDADGRVNVTYSAVASVTVAAVRMPPN